VTFEPVLTPKWRGRNHQKLLRPVGIALLS
jgi:hypothetical protein